MAPYAESETEGDVVMANVEKSVVISKEVETLIKRAESAAEMRRSAPAVTVKGQVSIPQHDIINRVSKGMGGQDGDFHWTFQNKEDVNTLVDKGYCPGTDPADGKWVNLQGMPLMKLPIDLWEQHLRENSAQSNAMLGSKIKGERGRKTSKRGGKTMVDIDEQVEITKGGKELFAGADEL